MYLTIEKMRDLRESMLYFVERCTMEKTVLLAFSNSVYQVNIDLSLWSIFHPRLMTVVGESTFCPWGSSCQRAWNHSSVLSNSYDSSYFLLLSSGRLSASQCKALAPPYRFPLVVSPVYLSVFRQKMIIYCPAIFLFWSASRSASIRYPVKYLFWYPPLIHSPSMA